MNSILRFESNKSFCEITIEYTKQTYDNKIWHYLNYSSKFNDNKINNQHPFLQALRTNEFKCFPCSDSLIFTLDKFINMEDAILSKYSGSREASEYRKILIENKKILTDKKYNIEKNKFIDGMDGEIIVSNEYSNIIIEYLLKSRLDTQLKKLLLYCIHSLWD